MMNVTLLATAGSVIIAGLASYAGYLLFKLKQQKARQLRQQQVAIDKRNANIFESVNLLCLAGIQQQCDLAEISIRLYNIMDYVQGEARLDFAQEFPAITQLFHIVNPMARGEERQKLPKQERMRQNLERHKAESRLEAAIIAELQRLREKVQPLSQGGDESAL